MPTITRRPARLAALGLAGALTSAGLAVAVAGPSYAAEGDPVLAWEISPRFDDHLSTHVLGDGASEDETGAITFPDGVGSFDAATGVASVSYQGSVSGSFVNAGTTFYTVTVADPTVTVDADGTGTISAVVSAWNAGGMGSSEASTEPVRVVVTTFTAPESWTVSDGLGAITATPDWAGVLPADSEQATALGIGAGKPVDGKSFAPTFLGQLTPGVRAHFYASGASSDAAKQPSPFTAEASVEAPSVSLATSYADRAVTIAVSGSDFTPTDGNPGDDGVYAGLAPAGGMPDVDDMEDMDSFAAAAWVPASGIAGGELSTTLQAAGADLDPGTSYSVYTWRAHSHSTTSQDTETPVELDWTQLTPVVEPEPVVLATTTGAAWKKKPTVARAGRLAVVVSAKGATPTGSVKVVLTKGGKQVKVAATRLAKGKATPAVKRLPAGTWKVKVSYLGADGFKASAKTLTVKVKPVKKKRK